MVVMVYKSFDRDMMKTRYFNMFSMWYDCSMESWKYSTSCWLPVW